MNVSPTDIAIVALAVLVLVVAPIWAIDRRTKRIENLLDALHRGSVTLEPSDVVKALAADPRKKVEAMTAYRQQTGLGLREAKAVVERLARDPQRPDV